MDGVREADLTLVDEGRDPPTTRTRRYASVGTPVNEISDTVDAKHATVVLTRRQTVGEGGLRERIELGNHHPDERTLTLEFGFGADLADIFEVRRSREALDRDVVAEADDRTVTYRYDYADDAGTTRTLETEVRFDAEPTTLEPGDASVRVALGSQETASVTVSVTAGGDVSTVGGVSTGARASPSAGDDAVGGRVDPFVADHVETGDPAYDRTFEQARRDVRALSTRTEEGTVPLAGAPWFVTVFGRDALLASHLLLPSAPSLARGTLRYLAARQGQRRDAHRDEAPGKIPHEVRHGELARPGVIPHTPSYGSADATPLWVTLLHETWLWTGDDALVEDLWPNLEAALEFLDAETAAVGENPFLYYRHLGRSGVTHQVWRDSANGVQNADGAPATPPLASASVQGYRYDALRRAAALVAAVDEDVPRAADLLARADALAERFDEAFWLPDRGFYATALTEPGCRVDSVTSVAGHCLWSGIVPTGRADAVVDRLLDDDLFSGWGIRTLSAAEEGYSPVSYHAGGVWPHDNALAALGFARYGRHDAVERLVRGQFDAFSEFSNNSVPELFCGFEAETAPVTYPSACRPQVWAAAAPFGLLRALLDVRADAVTAAGESFRRSGAVSPPTLDGVFDRWR